MMDCRVEQREKLRAEETERDWIAAENHVHALVQSASMLAIIMITVETAQLRASHC